MAAFIDAITVTGCVEYTIHPRLAKGLLSDITMTPSRNIS